MNDQVRAASYRGWLASVRATRWELLRERYAATVKRHEGQRKAWDELHSHVNLMLREGI